ncbi:MAG: asparagine synthase (glutamine-hydrolyzing) [Euryarchaeota archaeon]|jgi:asparagine synthase (glutamine-hydrolysing)|nr:asparagine synthase (glutamine-hydrolyzing) [Euryarchaeota archaeon]MBT5594509.1 asparagine synthase (glutamine-hydrolyzing) [Euryarchaeota archaeon]MBT5844644.1 asparagine synthase (glutamine-hydrolyzing) [Euryarchaeota archaeon]MBT6641165.1 asparagine synthase (glutamine-hydrolyzing) [Euryarchaeota archaeon]MBT6844412.1 asparagine synthase (glutamine-hydrolyzing) [Euryarchaeota archaeon]
MCGIDGMLGGPDPSVVHRMNALLAHRGPNGNAIWTDDHISIGHTRLAIVDIAGSNQPLFGIENEVLVANCEIYNYREIRSQNRSFAWKTKGDSEVILALHHASKSKSPGVLTARQHAEWIAQLNGMYAFALWDAETKHLLLARDPLGIKPLVRTSVDGSLLFASESKALSAHEGHVPEINQEALVARLAWEYTLDGTTLLKEVTQIRPGTVEIWSIDSEGVAQLVDVATIEQQRVKPSMNWNPESDAECLLETFVEGVSERLMSEVPVGIVLSGGLDSSLVAAVAHEAAERAQQPVPACWTVAESEDNPDWIAAEEVASKFDLKHHKHLLEADSFETLLPNLSWHGEDLDVTVLFFQPLFQKMSQHVTVGLCGQGADELHAGYPRYRNLKRHGEIIDSRLASMSHPFARKIENEMLPVGENWYATGHAGKSHTGSLEEFLQFELEHGQLSNFQLRLVDRHSMAHSLEVRVPFLSAAHRQASHRLPMDWRLPSHGDEKAALRAAASLTALPKNIVHRPKLPAGRATSPRLIENLLTEYQPQTDAIIQRYPLLAGALKTQPDIALGLGLFEAVHILDRGAQKPTGSTLDLLEEVIG